MTLQKHILAMMLGYLFLCISLAVSRPLSLPSDDSAALQSRLSVCRPIVGCVPFFKLRTWHSFELTIPAPADPLFQTSHSPGGEVEASVWNRADGSAFLGIHLGDNYDMPGHSEMQSQARFRNTAINLNRNSIDLEGEGGFATIPASTITSWRQGNRVGNTITLTIRWSLNQEF